MLILVYIHFFLLSLICHGNLLSSVLLIMSDSTTKINLTSVQCHAEAHGCAGPTRFLDSLTLFS